MLSTTRFRDEDSPRPQCFRRHPDLIIQIDAKDKRTVPRPNSLVHENKRTEGPRLLYRQSKRRVAFPPPAFAVIM